MAIFGRMWSSALPTRTAPTTALADVPSTVSAAFQLQPVDRSEHCRLRLGEMNLGSVAEFIDGDEGRCRHPSSVPASGSAATV